MDTKRLIPTTVLFQKAKEGSPVKDMVDDFDMALISFPLVLSGGTKDFYANNWKDDDGEEAFFPERAPLAPFDLSITLGVKGTVSGYLDKWRLFNDYLTGADGNGTDFAFYSPWYDLGFHHCYFKGYKAKDGNREIEGSIFHTFEATFRITEPETFIVAVLDPDGNYSLQERKEAGNGSV